jgi:hypothetical protein
VVRLSAATIIVGFVGALVGMDGSAGEAVILGDCSGPAIGPAAGEPGDGFSLGRIPLKPVKRGKDVPDLFGSAFGRRQHPELIPVEPHGEVRTRDGPSLNARQISRRPSQPQRDRTGC